MMIPVLFLLSSLLCRVTAFSLSAPISHAVSCRLSQRAANRNAAARRSFFFSLHPPNSSSIVSSALSSSSSDDNSGRTTSEAERLRQKAIKLRAEADAAEKQLSPTRSTRQSVVDSSNTKEVAVEYFDLKDSCWELSYRFANEPERKNDDDDNKANKMPRKFYSGKIQLQFKSDGYTINLSTNSEIGEQQARIKKVWGWDVEISDQDSLSYILFSADITLPPPVDTSERFYFQARVDGGQKEDGEEALSLQDGSVTVKRDISAPSGGWWGIFRGADGILAQFRQVGEFRCRPIAKP